MKEEYLHLIWKQKRLPFHQMKLTNGQEFILKSSGSHNLESGPDFFDGEVVIDSIHWRGNIEIHVKSSDWNLHKHQYDNAYDNVVLHVVFEHDLEIVVNGRVLPTLELKGFLQKEHLDNYLKRSPYGSTFLCAQILPELDVIYLESMKERAIYNRLDRKIKLLNPNLGAGSDFGQILYCLLAQAFGMKVNSIPFQELSNRIPLKILKRENEENFFTLICGTSGLLEKTVTDQKHMHNWHFLKNKYDLNSMGIHVWKKKGLRPKGFPEVRLFQFSEVVKNFDFNTIFTAMYVPEMVDYFKNILTITSKISSVQVDPGKIEISNTTKESIISNSFVPFLWWYGTLKNDEEMKEKAIHILLHLQPEKNTITTKWIKMGVKIKKAYDSQALLEIYNDFCSRKKCLSCVVGDKIING